MGRPKDQDNKKWKVEKDTKAEAADITSSEVDCWSNEFQRSHTKGSLNFYILFWSIELFKFKHEFNYKLYKIHLQTIHFN